MKETKSKGTLSLSFIVFTFIILITLGFSYYVKYTTDKLNLNIFNTTADSIKIILEQEINDYRSCYYRAIPHLTSMYDSNDQSFKDFSNLDSIFCKTQEIIIVDENKELEEEKYLIVKNDKNNIFNQLKELKETTRFKSLINDAFKGNSPKIFITEYPNEVFNMSAIVPIKDNGYKTYAFLNIGLNNIFNKINNANLLGIYTNMSLIVKDIEEDNEIIEFNNIEEDSKNTVKRHKEPLTKTYVIELYPEHIHISFKEISSNITNTIKNFSILINSLGFLIAIVSFISIYYSMYISNKK